MKIFFHPLIFLLIYGSFKLGAEFEKSTVTNSYNRELFQLFDLLYYIHQNNYRDELSSTLITLKNEPFISNLSSANRSLLEIIARKSNNQ